jgi:hypothetical protein
MLDAPIHLLACDAQRIELLEQDATEIGRRMRAACTLPKKAPRSRRYSVPERPAQTA